VRALVDENKTCFARAEQQCLFPLRLRVALRGVAYSERNRNAIGVSISLATQRNAQP